MVYNETRPLYTWFQLWPQGKYRIFPIRTPRPNSAPVLIEPRENSVKKK